MNLNDQRTTFIINLNYCPSSGVRNRYSLASSEFRWIKSGRKVLRCIKLQPKLSPGKVPEPFPSSFVDPRRTETKIVHGSFHLSAGAERLFFVEGGKERHPVRIFPADNLADPFKCARITCPPSASRFELAGPERHPQSTDICGASADGRAFNVTVKWFNWIIFNSFQRYRSLTDDKTTWRPPEIDFLCRNQVRSTWRWFTSCSHHQGRSLKRNNLWKKLKVIDAIMAAVIEWKRAQGRSWLSFRFLPAAPRLTWRAGSSLSRHSPANSGYSSISPSGNGVKSVAVPQIVCNWRLIESPSPMNNNHHKVATPSVKWKVNHISRHFAMKSNNQPITAHRVTWLPCGSFKFE